MDETAARDLVLVRAIETTDRTRVLWSDIDRAWASRAAAEVVTGAASEEIFLARRAALARGRLAQRLPLLRRAWRAFTWPTWLAPAFAIAAFVTGVAVDRIGSEARINLLAPPILGLIGWNLIVYFVLAFGALRRLLGGGGTGHAGPMRAWLARVAGARAGIARSRAPRALVDALAAFGAQWSRVCAKLYAVRAARILHLAAAAFALGVIAGFYFRGLALEYRASWQSTFLDAGQVHALLAIVLAPGAWITGLPIPGAEHVARLRTNAAAGGENAASWLHLYAATLLIAVIVPRMALAALAWAIERRRGASLAVDLADPYFRRLVRAFAHGPLTIAIWPYSYAIPSSALERLHAIATRAFGQVVVQTCPTVRYGDEDTLVRNRPEPEAQVVLAVFNATATPESEAHGAFLAALRGVVGNADVAAVVDESALRARWPNGERRWAERRDAWQALLAAAEVPTLFVDLAGSDLDAPAQALQAALEGRIA